MIYGTDMGGFASGFVHKRLIGGVKGFLTGGPVGAVAGVIAPQARQLPVRRPPPRTTTARPSVTSAAEKEAGRAVKFGNGVGMPTARAFGGDNGCVFPFRRDPITGRCRIFVGERPGPNGGPVPERGLPAIASGADAVMGRFGAGYFPGSRVIDRAVCLPGDVVATDGLCYPRTKLRNADRAWPRGRRPLLTGGEMRAISTAARAGKRLEGATKRLQKIGLMKKPATPRPKLLKSGPEVHHHHES